jgi:hypothetical protein
VKTENLSLSQSKYIISDCMALTDMISEARKALNK